MIDLVMSDIAAAQENDISAVTRVIEAMESRIGQLATRHAGKGGQIDRDLFEELEQIGRITCWESIAKFKGTTVAEFFSYMDRMISGDMGDARRVETRKGVSSQVSKFFETALTECGGDPYAAQQYAAGEAFGERKLSKDMALAARLAWQGVVSFDQPIRGGVGSDGVETSDNNVGKLVSNTHAVPDDLMEPSDREAERKRIIRESVHATLNKLGTQAAYVLRSGYGLAPVPFHGTSAEADEEIAAVFGSTPGKVRVVRSKAKARFRELYLKGPAAAADAI